MALRQNEPNFDSCAMSALFSLTSRAKMVVENRDRPSIGLTSCRIFTTATLGVALFFMDNTRGEATARSYGGGLQVMVFLAPLPDGSRRTMVEPTRVSFMRICRAAEAREPPYSSQTSDLHARLTQFLGAYG